MASSSYAAILLGPPSVATADVKQPMGLTENLSPTFLSSGNPCLDFFFHIVPDTSPRDLIQRLEISWGHDPLTTLKLVCNLRGVRGTGKSDKEGFYTAAFWLYQNHPKTLALNLPAIVEFGYLKDLPEILFRILEGQQMERGESRSWRKKNERKPKQKSQRKSKRSFDLKDLILEKLQEFEQTKGSKMSGPDEKTKARALRKQRELEKAKKALDMYSSDANYRLLFDRVADFFAELLKSDLEYLNSNELNKISLASKWCPSVDSSYDKTTLICEAIARRMFPRKEYEGIEETRYVYMIRDRLRKQVLVPLHKALELPELSMSEKEWNLLKYNRVASVAMKNYKELFVKHDKERFMEFLQDVRSGKAKIAAGALLPHELISELEYVDDVGEEVVELQWARMVDDLLKKGEMKNSLAVCDVSGSMSGTPMEVCVALGLLVSELNQEPWKGKVITFSQNPKLHLVKGSSLREKTKFIEKMEWGMNTNFQKVFDRILEVAVENNLTDDEMIKRIFVFSDMEFDEAMYISDTESNDVTSNSDMESDDDDDNDDDNVDDAGWKEWLKKKWQMIKRLFGFSDMEFDDATSDVYCGPSPSNECGPSGLNERWETDYRVIRRKYKKNGFKNVPEIVFWNLRDSSSTPVVATEKGVAMVSGFSKNLLTLFLDKGGIVTPEDLGIESPDDEGSMSPEDVMLLAITREEYEKLVIYD